MEPGDEVEHPEYGVGTVRQALGDVILVEFFGEEIDVPRRELTLRAGYKPGVAPPLSVDQDAIRFRQAFEALNLGVVPGNPTELIYLTIGGERIASDTAGRLEVAASKGFCETVFGYYGAGKTHYLQLVKAIALRYGWVTAFLEFDPKAADPAKPHLVYAGLTAGLSFPLRENSETPTEGFFGFVKEIRARWPEIKRGKYMSRSPWFLNALQTITHYPHNEDQDYLDAIGWLSGQATSLQVVRRLAKNTGEPGLVVPNMPRTKEVADIYVFHLVVLHEICRGLGYKGLLLIVDEAEHVRGFNVRRRERATNFFDILARAAHPPILDDPPPYSNEHGVLLPPYWREGPHFGLAVGLTEGGIFADPDVPLREACIFLHTEADRVRLRPPVPDAYEDWCRDLLAASARYLETTAPVFGDPGTRSAIARVLAEEFAAVQESERVLRNWVKLGNLAPSILLAQGERTVDELCDLVRAAARQAVGRALPWGT